MCHHIFSESVIVLNFKISKITEKCNLLLKVQKNVTYNNCTINSFRFSSASTPLSNPRTPYRFTRRYQGKIKAVIFDWAGTVIDCGVFAPARTFVEIFKLEGVPISDEEARGPMGTHKRVSVINPSLPTGEGGEGAKEKKSPH